VRLAIDLLRCSESGGPSQRAGERPLETGDDTAESGDREEADTDVARDADEALFARTRRFMQIGYDVGGRVSGGAVTARSVLENWRSVRVLFHALPPSPRREFLDIFLEFWASNRTQLYSRILGAGNADQRVDFKLDFKLK